MSLNDKKRKIDWRNECIFCGKKKTWKTDVQISYQNETVLTVTVCPECREKYTVAEVYSRINKKLMTEKFLLETLSPVLALVVGVTVGSPNFVEEVEK